MHANILRELFFLLIVFPHVTDCYVRLVRFDANSRTSNVEHSSLDAEPLTSDADSSLLDSKQLASDAEAITQVAQTPLDLQMECETVFASSPVEKDHDDMMYVMRKYNQNQLTAVANDSSEEMGVDADAVKMKHAESIFFHDHHYTRKHPASEKVGSRTVSQMLMAGVYCL
jgi:hypothetical protein